MSCTLEATIAEARARARVGLRTPVAIAVEDVAELGAAGAGVRVRRLSRSDEDAQRVLAEAGRRGR